METKEIKLINKRFEDQMKNLNKFEKSVRELFRAYKEDNDKAHLDLTGHISALSDDLRDPHKGLWAETKANTSFRKNTTKILMIILPVMLLAIGWLIKNSITVIG